MVEGILLLLSTKKILTFKRILGMLTFVDGDENDALIFCHFIFQNCSNLAVLRKNISEL